MVRSQALLGLGATVGPIIDFRFRVFRIEISEISEVDCMSYIGDMEKQYDLVTET